MSSTHTPFRNRSLRSTFGSRRLPAAVPACVVMLCLAAGCWRHGFESPFTASRHEQERGEKQTVARANHFDGDVAPAVGNSNRPEARGYDERLRQFRNDPSRPAPAAISVPGNAAWVDTGISVTAGEALTLTAGGAILIPQTGRWGRDEPIQVDPAGTYFFTDEQADKPFPLPSGNRGPAPCFGLIGRIGSGPIFFVGKDKSWVAQQSGTLFLGINDFDVASNRGRFVVEAVKSRHVQPIRYEQIVAENAPQGMPQAGASVVVLYVDGLRPDVVQEMAALGHIPHINELFVEGGIWNSNCFTVFPSDTITANGTMWTGCFSDRHGIKGQVRFSRHRQASESYLDPLGPNRSARLLAPQGIDKFLLKAKGASIGLVRGSEEQQRYFESRTTNVPPIYMYLRSEDADWATGVLPMMTEVPPPLWMRSMGRHLPYGRSDEAWRYIDDANAHYAVRHLLGRRQPVTIVWLPETDSCSHKCCRGQFGNTRRTIAHADRLIGEIVEELRLQGRLDSTYLMLVSDHGHQGGRTGHLSNFDLANRVFHQPREVTADGRWIGGGLGLSVRQHRFYNRHQGDGRREFIFIDGDSDGAARIFLPRGHYRSGDWSGPNRPADLLAYRVDEHLPPVDLVQSLVNVPARHGCGTMERPIDLVLMRLHDNAILISTADRGQAVIERVRDQAGPWLYRYTPVTDVAPTADGGVVYRPVPHPQTDPLGLCGRLSPEFLATFHDERIWLKATAGSKYPDSVVALTRHMLWQDSLQVREQDYASDLVVTAHDGWYFGQESSPGTMHGYPLADSMRATWFITGPNVRRGARNLEPCRLADLTPTILEMVGIFPAADRFDGQPLRTIYESEGEPAGAAVVQAGGVRQHDAAAGLRAAGADGVHAGNARGGELPVRPVYWQDVDLQAWRPLRYRPMDVYEHMPWTINQPERIYDLNNIVYNLVAVGELSVLRIFDDVISPLSPRRPRIAETVERADQQARNANSPWLAEAAQALDVPGVSLSDYSITSQGNLKRIDGTVHWVQQRTRELDRLAAAPFGRSQLPGSEAAHTVVDTARIGFWELYRFAQRVLIEVVDERLLSGFEDRTDATINRYRRVPAEVVVPEGSDE